jgi:hypothetical protein
VRKEKKVVIRTTASTLPKDIAKIHSKRRCQKTICKTLSKCIAKDIAKMALLSATATRKAKLHQVGIHCQQD